MMSDYFAQSDAKMDTFKKPGKYSVYLQTQRVVTVGQTQNSSSGNNLR